MLSGMTVVALILCSLLHDAGSEGTNYILPALGLGGDTEVSITFLMSNLNTKDVYPFGRLIHNNTVVASFNATVCDDQVETYMLEGFQESDLLNGSELTNKSIEVTYNSLPFSLHVIYEKNGYTEGYAAISTADVGNEYYVSTFCALGGYCQIAVASVDPGLTLVYIKLPAEVDEVVICVGEQKWRSKYHTTFNLTYPETLQIETTHDLTGTYIYSDGPISVIASTRSMPGRNGTLFHFMEQLAPVSHWGSEFVVRGLNTAYGSVLHITSSKRKTVVEMTGFKTVEMSRKGQTLKRRLEESVVCYIKSNNPIQVMMYVGLTYGSDDVMTSVGMTSVPATEQSKMTYLVDCKTTPMTFFQYVLEQGDAIASHVNSISTKVFPTKYQVNTVNRTSGSQVYPISTEKGLPFGGIFQCNTAVFPMASSITTSTGCIANIDTRTIGDGVDNDCDGEIDEDYCFEGAKITSTFIPGVSTEIPAHITDMTGFHEILLRVQTCGSIQLELRDKGDGKIVIHISKSQILLYECFPDCSNHQIISTATMLENINCSSDVISYWMMQASGFFYLNIGRRNFDNGIPNNVILTSDLVEMRFSGLMNNATIWYDLYRTDCGKLRSDWRCHDAVTNCFEYDDDLCTNSSYTAWVELNCRKFCGLCSPDSFGRMFVYYPAPWASLKSSQNLKFVGINVSTSRIGIQTASSIQTTFPQYLEQRHNVSANISCTSALISSTAEPMFIFTEVDAEVHFSFQWNDKKSRLLQPLDALGTEYMTISFGSSTLQCTCVAVEPTTTTTIYNGDSVTSYSNYTFLNKTLSFNQTGTVMTGNKPFAVFCGTDEFSEYGYSWFQLPATKTWGKHYITPSLGTSFILDIRAKIKIVANSNNTAVEVHGDFDGIYLLLARGDSLVLPTDPSVSYNISSNFPVGVAIIFHNSAKNSSSFHILPPTESFMDNPILFSYIDFFDNVTSLTSTPSVGNITEFTFNDTDLPAGVFIYEVQDASSFLLFLREYPAGIDVTASASLYQDLSLTQICHLDSNTVGDDTDADCDGLIDEETVCYVGYGSRKQDIDLDGAFGEDCQTFEIGTAIVSVPSEPVCTTPLVNNNGTGCWKNCQCYCSWASKLDEYQNMNKSEQDAYNQAVIEKYQKALEVDEEKLSSTMSTKQSADDQRTSSKSIGVAGCIFIAVVLGLVVIFDVISIVQKIRERRRQSEVQEIK